MSNRTVCENSDVRCAATDIDKTHTQVPFVLCDHRVAGRELLENDAVDCQAAALNTFLNILCCIHSAGDEVHLGFETNTRHAQGFANTGLVVDHILLRQHMKDLLVCGNRHRLRGIDDPIHILLKDLLIPYGNNAVRIH